MKYLLEIITIITIIFFAAFFVMQNSQIQSSLQTGGAAWTGADSKAAAVIEASGYTPWFNPLWEPPSGEIETLFFCIQASVGSLVIGYFFGYYRGKAVRD